MAQAGLAPGSPFGEACVMAWLQRLRWKSVGRVVQIESSKERQSDDREVSSTSNS